MRRRTGRRSAKWDMQLTFWGVRGSIPTPAASHLGVGGNTACVSVTTDAGDEVIFDAGTGIRTLGRALESANGTRSRRLNLFLSHFHWDHIQGLAFFAPLYDPSTELIIHTPVRVELAYELLSNAMRPPHFSIAWEDTPARKTLVCLGEAPVQYDGFCVWAFPLNHPQGACGFRLLAGNRAVVYASDTEHGRREFDDVLRARSEGADVLIYDAQYSRCLYEQRRGWGHSTWEAGVRFAREAGVKTLALFHHDPSHDDAAISTIIAEARVCFPRTVAAREGPFSIEGDV